MQLSDFFRSDVLYLLIDAMVLCLLYMALVRKKADLFVAASFSAFAVVFKLVIFVGFRPFDAGNDTIGYYHTFQLLEGVESAREIGGSYGGTEKAGELLYWPFAAFLKPFLADSFRLFLIISILISGYLTYLGNKKLLCLEGPSELKVRTSVAVIVTYLVFLSFEIAYFGGHIRSAFGIPLALIAFYFACSKRLVLSAVSFFLAVGFHNSAVSVLPLLVMQLLTPNISQSKKLTALIVSSLVVAFYFGLLGGIGGVIGIFSDFYQERYNAYVEYTGFNVDSVFATAYFWIILVYVIIFLVVGYSKVHLYAFYYMGLIFLFSETPKISERFFAYILICLPSLFYASLRTRFDDRKAIFITATLSYAINPLVITSYAVLGSLSIHSYIISR